MKLSLSTAFAATPNGTRKRKSLDSNCDGANPTRDRAAPEIRIAESGQFSTTRELTCRHISHMLPSALCLFLLVISSTVLAEPVHLRCNYNSETTPGFQVSINEKSGKVFHVDNPTTSFRADGFFTIDTISYQNDNHSNSISILQKYEINRDSLKFDSQSIIKIGNTDPTTVKNQGQCSIEEPGERKI